MVSAERILVIGPSNIGDGILIGDVILRLRARFPQGHMTLVVGSRAKTLFEADPRIQTLVDSNAFDSFFGRLKLLAALWRYQPHVVVDLRHTFYPLLLKPASAWRYLLSPPAGVRHMKARHLWKLDRQVPGAGTGSPEGVPGMTAVWLTERDQAQVQMLRRRWALEAGRPVVVVCPGARSHLKRWTAEGFALVADRLIGERRAQVIFSGEPEEEAIIEEIRGLMRGKAITAVGLMTLPQVGLLMQDAALVVTNDSASLHLASAAGAPTLALFGPTDESKYGPTAARHRVIRRQLVCAPCERAVCRFNHECMRFITSEEVFTAASDLLQQATSNKQQRRVGST